MPVEDAYVEPSAEPIRDALRRRLRGAARGADRDALRRRRGEVFAVELVRMVISEILLLVVLLAETNASERYQQRSLHP